MTLYWAEIRIYHFRANEWMRFVLCHLGSFIIDLGIVPFVAMPLKGRFVIF